MNDLFDSLPHTAEPVDWTPDRGAGLARLNSFLPSAGRAYASSRNFDFGAENRSNVSALSPWLRHRLITETEVLSAVQSKHGYNASEKFIQEVFWRGYFKGWMQHRPQVWDEYRADVSRLAETLEDEPELKRRYTQATTGQTGIDAFDHWIQELIETGYLHNHARMWFASIWIFTLKLPWQLGADFFAQHLLDWDPASNTLSWRWVGGLHTVGKTYMARPDNIAKYTDGRFNPAGQLATDAPALSEGESPTPRVLSDVPAELTGAGPSILVITDEDVSIDQTHLNTPDIRGVLGLTVAAGRSPYTVSEKARDFANAAVTNGVAQASKVCGDAPSTIVNYNQWGNEWGGAISDFARACGAHRMITAEIPVGPASDAMRNAAPELGAAYIKVDVFRQTYDQAVWPHTKKGFFGLKKQIPAILSTLGIAP
jgi:deoxyribodipyrimidine photo-lyase